MNLRTSSWRCSAILGLLLGICAALGSLLLSVEEALAQQIVELPEQRTVNFLWGASRRALYADLTFRDIIDERTQGKLKRGLPTEILFTALLYSVGSSAPLSTSYQSCKITWHVWEEMYRVEVTRTNKRTVHRHWTPNLNGVLRRCAELNRLLVADSSQVSAGRELYMTATVRINPVSEELLAKLKRWVSRPTQTGTASPGSALFSTFTGLFMQRIGDAERTISFVTKRQLPR